MIGFFLKGYSLPKRDESDDSGIDLEEVRMHPQKSCQVLRFLEWKTIELRVL
jgi:hypothetical protein